MGTKNNPGEFDCYAKAEPDEPMFILLGRDPLAADLVREWARRRVETRGPSEKVDQAIECAEQMDRWRTPVPTGEVEPHFAPQPLIQRARLERLLASVVNQVSAENGSNTPDFIIGAFLVDCLLAFDQAVRTRAGWRGESGALQDRGLARFDAREEQEVLPGDSRAAFSAD